MNRSLVTKLSITLSGCLILAAALTAQDSKQALQQKVAAFKQATALNQKALQQYSWTENTQLSLKGDVKSTKVEACRYGPDGKVQKTPLSAPLPPKEMRGAKKRIVEKKTDEMKDYMERAVALVKQYVPPSPDLIQASLAAGNASLSPMGGEIQLQFKNYVKPGDLLSVTVDSAAKTMRQLKVDSYLDEEKDKVDLAVSFQTMPDGTNYAASKVLNVAAKQIVVNITDSNYQKLAQ
jgi:hypothetical protein